ncbi:MAG: copper oxidase [Gammaproteobacteria bacterium RIFCSPHIGHO2_12_FULL_38_14]|nr:MAG: copper oxidase [Gammaproteobacteria bacterium RIFCSPHIGHO2_12_FULL_38_14]
MKKINHAFLIVIILGFLGVSNAFATARVVDLVVSYKTVNFSGKYRKAIAVNNQIPAPTLHFKEGDKITLNVHNQLDKETAIHWHGIIVPWQMDGVLGINQQGIPPGGVFHYQFTLKQAGTYWYHAHASLQEQQGLYGAFLIDPPKHPAYKYTKDYVVVLSDWSNTNPDQILSNLKKEGDYYSPNFPLQPSLAKFTHDYRKASIEERQKLIDDYKMMQQMRMSIYDISDVAYDAFLLNGQPKSNAWTAPVKIGDVVRLRFIGAGGSTIFHAKIPNTMMQVVHVDGNDVRPYTVTDLTIAPGETYDVLVKIQKSDPYIIYAESIDTVGAAYGALVTSPNQIVNYKAVTPFPEPLPVTREMMSMMMGNMTRGTLPQNRTTDTSVIRKPLGHAHSMNNIPHQMKMSQHNMASMENMHHHDGASVMSDNMKMDHGMAMNHSMNMPTEPSVIGDTIAPPNSSYATSAGTKYDNLIGAVKTNNPNKPVTGVINMELFGYMDRFIWFINGVPEHKAHPIVLEPGKRYRFVFTNTSMMHHPMHIHGHWFILRKGNGAYDPLLHTIDVPPGATITADVDTDASGQWIFHCHLLYHMMAGMARTFQYSTLIEITKDEVKPQNIVKQTPYNNRPIVRVDEVRPIDPMLVKHPMAHPDSLWLATFLDISVNPVTNVGKINFKGLYGSDYNKLELFTNDAEIKKGKVENADMDIFYWHLLDQFWAIKGGVNYFYRPAQTPYWQPGIGIEGLMPYFINTDFRGYFYSGSAKLDIELSRDTQITNNFFIRAGIRSILASKTVTQTAIGSGLNQMQYTLRPYCRLMPGLNIFAEFERDQYYGSFKNIQRNIGNSTGENTLTFGLSILF